MLITDGVPGGRHSEKEIAIAEAKKLWGKKSVKIIGVSVGTENEKSLQEITGYESGTIIVSGFKEIETKTDEMHGSRVMPEHNR